MIFKNFYKILWIQTNYLRISKRHQVGDDRRGKRHPNSLKFLILPRRATSIDRGYYSKCEQGLIK